MIDAEGGERTFPVPLHMLHNDVADAIDSLLGVMVKRCTPPPDSKPFGRLLVKMLDNFAVASGSNAFDFEESNKEPVWASKAKDKSASELVDCYLGGTPFPHFLNTSLPVAIPLASRFEHMHIVGGSGHGKTQLLQNFILHDIHKLREGGRSVIVMDSQGDLMRQIQQLAILEEIADRVVIIDPHEINAPPALNLFDIGLDRLTHYTPLEQEMLLNGAIELYKYMFGVLLGADLTQKQGLIFRYLALLVMLVPNATIKTFMGFLQAPESIRPHLTRLKEDAAVRVFFETQFFAKKFDDTGANPHPAVGCYCQPNA